MLDYMRFLDPHGVERVDAEVYECTAKRHSFTATDGGGVRLLASDGSRPKQRESYVVTDGRLEPTRAAQQVL